MNKYNRHPNQYSIRDPRGLYLLLAIMVTGFIIKTVYDPLPEPISPRGVSIVQAKEPASEPIVEPSKPQPMSKRTKQCIELRPDVADRIDNLIGDRHALDLICRESSFNPQAINPSSKACGLAQALPCSKMKCELSDVDCQLKWIKKYVEGRYGSFENAIKFHNENNYY